MDRVSAFLSEKTPRRFLALSTFLGVLYLFRQLALLLVFFVMFQRALAWSSKLLARHAGLTRRKSLFALVLALMILLGIGGWLGIGKTIRTMKSMQGSFAERFDELRSNPLLEKLQEQIGGSEKIVDGIRHGAGDALAAASAVGHFFVYVVIGFILAFVYTLEEDELATFWNRVERRSLGGSLGRWFGHLADATIVTVHLQLVVAAFNTATTLPVLLLLGIPHIAPLMLLVLVSALVPVIGNVVSGTILALLAYQANGWLGVGIFVTLTFILHKVESYYLSPRLTARHVKIPGFLLIVSLLLCEHLFGFKGLFLSFPILFVAGRIRTEFLEEDAISSSSPFVLTDGLDQLPTTMQEPATAKGDAGFELER